MNNVTYAWKKTRILILVVLMMAAQLSTLILDKNVAHAADNNQNVEQAADNGLAKKPYMGWSSYSMQVFSGNGQWITEAQIKAQSDAMHQKLQEYGYNYINIDAGWSGGLDEYGRPYANAALFPSGFQNLIDYIHNNGQKVGIYMIPGLAQQAYNGNWPIYGAPGCHMQDIAVKPLTTADYWGYTYKIDFSNPCAQKYVNSIADEFASWGIDFVKFDSVTPGSGHNDTTIDARGDVQAWSQALSAHHIWYEISWALDHNYVDFWKKHANGWRVDWDIECYCGNKGLTAWNNIARLFPDAALWWRDAGPGGWNDFDSLNIGNGAMDGLTMDERQTAMTLWAISSAQLYTGNDLTNLDDYGLKLLTNEEAIAVNQAGHPAHPVSMATNQQVWYANNSDGTYTVGLFNLGSSPATVKVDWKDIGLTGSAVVRDLWTHQKLGTFDTGFSSVDLPSHGSRLLKVTSTGGLSAVNDDDTGISYSGSWERNGGHELAQPQQNLVVTVSDSATKNSTINPVTASFDKKTANQADITTTLNLNGNTLSGIANGKTAMVPNQDYTVSGNQVTISKAYLATLPNGTTYLTFSFSAGGTQTLTVTIKDTTPRDSAIIPTLISFDKKISAQTDPTVTLSLNGNTLSSITNIGVPLVQGTDYKLSEDQLVIERGYLAGLPAGMANLKLGFSQGAAQNLTVVVSDTSKDASFTLNDDNTGIVYTGSWNWSTNRNIGDYMNDVHWTESGTDSFSYTFKGTGITFYTEKDPSQGDIDIYVDGQFKQTVSTHDLGRSTQQAVYNIAGLDYGTHTLKAVRKTGWFMLLDKLRVSLPDLISPTAASFDKSAQADVSVTTTVYGSTDEGGLKGISKGGTILAAGTDYTVSGDQVTLKKEYLAAQPLGTINLQFSLNSGAVQSLDVMIKDASVTDSTISPSSAFFDKKSTAQADVPVTMALNGNVLSSITNGGTALVAGTDYAVSGDKATLKKEYLSSQPLGITTLAFNFSAGASKTFTVTVSDSTPTLSPSTVSFDKKPTEQADVTTTITLNGDSFAGIVNGGTALVDGIDYQASGNNVTLRKEYLAALPAGVTNLTIQFTSGATQTLAVVVYESSKGRVVTLNDDAQGIMYTGNWNKSTNRGLGDYMDDVHWSETGHDSFAYTFAGTGIEVVSEKDPSQGDMDVYVDGVYKQTVSTYNSTKLLEQTVYSIAGLPFGTHTLKVVKQSGHYLVLDALRIILPDLITPDTAGYDKSAAASTDVTISLALDGSNLNGIANNGVALLKNTDYTVSGNRVTIKKEYLALQPVGTMYLTFSFTGNYMDDVHSTAANNDSFTYDFRGTGISLISDKSPDQGDMDIYVDGKFYQTVSSYNSVRLTQQKLFSISGLVDKPHTIKVVKKSGAYMVLDELIYSTGYRGASGDK
jgi:hypothetical protein